MEWYRSVFLALSVFLGYTIWQTYKQEHQPAPQTAQVTSAQKQAIQSDDQLPTASTEGWVDEPQGDSPELPNPALNMNAIPANSAASQMSNRFIQVQTDVFDILIDKKGGDLVNATLRQYPKQAKEPAPFALLSQDPAHYWVAQTGILGRGSPDQKTDRAVWSSDQTRYTLEPGQETLQVVLKYQDPKTKTDFKKIFLFKKGQYTVDLRYVFNNEGKERLSYRVWSQFKHQVPPQKSGSFMGVNTFTGGILSSPEKRFEKIEWNQFNRNSHDSVDVAEGWLAIAEQYFVGAVIPDPNGLYQYQARLLGDGKAALSLVSSPFRLNPNQSREEKLTFYLGPQKAKDLAALGTGLDRVIDYGWFWPIAELLFSILQQIHRLIGNWGWSIVLITVLIKAGFYHLSAKSFRSMAKMKKLQPKMEALKERYGDDRQKMSQAMMALYREEKVNPLGGCLPILVQIPVFIALYAVLLASVELRMAPFVGWIQDLSAPDPYFVLPILFGATMLLQQRLSPAPADPAQAKMMMLMPVVFTGLFLYFPSGLVLYWVVSNVLSIAQQWLIMRNT